MEPEAGRHAIDAVVLNYRTPRETLAAVRSLLASRVRPRYILVVDNDQSPDCAQALQPVWRDIEYEQNTANLGYSGGMNVGIRRALDRGAAAVLVLNSDVELEAGCLGELSEVFALHPAVGIAGPVVVAKDDPDRIASLGLSYRHGTGRMRHRSVGELRARVSLPRVQVVDAVSGCAMLVRRAVFEQSGLFEESYFFSFEDLDLCLNARRNGLTTVLAGRALASHAGGRSLDPRSPRRHYFAARNHLLLAQRISAPAGRARRFARSASIVLLNLAYAVRCGPRLLPARLGAVARGIHHHRLGIYGADS